MRPLLWDTTEIDPWTGKPYTWDSPNPNVTWDGILEENDPGYTPPPAPIIVKPKHKPRKYMASNPTPDPISELIAAGEDLYDGLVQHAVSSNIKQNTPEDFRADLDALITAQNALVGAEGAEPAAYATLRTADSNGKGFIARAIKVLSISLGNDWSAEWIATGLPDQKVGIPSTQDKRFTALSGLAAYFTKNPGKENAPLEVTAAIATTLHTAVSDARKGVGNALKLTKEKLIARDDAKTTFRNRFRGTINELEQKLSDEDPKWYDFGLNRPADPATPGQPSNVHATALGAARVLIQIDGARRANSFNYYKQVIGIDPEPVKILNTQGTQHTLENLPVGATVQITVTGVNDAGEGQPSEVVSVVVL
jgi:hypothetical protein